MATLHQLVAVEKSAKATAATAVTAAYHLAQKPELFAGIARTYEPLADDGEKLPAESTKVQNRAEELLAGGIRAAWTRLLDLVATKDTANTKATADIKVGDVVIAKAVPVTYLLWLEKQLADMITVVSRLPVLDEAFTWEKNSAGDWATPAVQTVKTKKVPRNHVKAPATDKHPAQVEMYHEDVQVGTWTTIRSSGAMPAARQRQILDRLRALLLATKFAREEANGLVVTDREVGANIFDFLLS